MAPGNKSTQIDFTVQGLSDSPHLQLPLFIIFSCIYFTIVLSNFTIILCIILDSHLHTPMYIFLCNLSVLDISYTSTILPKLLVMLYTQCRTISFVGCMIQLYFFLSFACVEILLLAAMAYDRYHAICRPLHYPLNMNLRCCSQLILAVWVGGFSDTILHAVLISNLSYCSSHHVDHFFCDVSPLLKLTCSDTFIIEIWTYVEGTLTGINAFVLILISYSYIISAILKINSSFGRQKAFSTCASHITCVVIFYGTMICLYLRPTSSYSPRQDKFFALLYIILIPLLNPIIYTMKNEDFKDVFKTINTKLFCFEM